MRKTILSLAIVLGAVFSLRASDQYVYPGGLNQTIYHWQYPDIATMQNDTGFFNQDIGKLAYIATPSIAGAGGIYSLGNITPTFAWAGGEPLRYSGGGSFSYVVDQNATTLFNVKNSDLGTLGIAGVRIIGGDTTAHIAAYIPGFSGTSLDSEPFVDDGVTFTNTRGPIIINGNGNLRLANNNTYLSAGVMTIGSSGQVTTDPNVTWTTGIWQFQKDQNALSYLAVANFTSGTAAKVQLQLLGSASDTYFTVFSSAYAVTGVRAVDDFEIQNSSRIVLSAGGAIVFSTDTGTTEAGRIETSGAGYKGPTTPRTSSTASTSSLTVNANSIDLQDVTALAVNMTINAPTGTPRDGQLLKFYIKDNGTARTLTWNAVFHNAPTASTRPTITTGVVHEWFQWSATTSSWDKIIEQTF
jgi:hypothetical protein